MYLKVVVVSFVVLLLGALIGFLAFPMLFQELVKRSVNLKPGSETRQMWEKLPFPMIFKLYVFNVSNPQEIEAGGKPRLQEVGPLVFEEWKDKFDVLDIEEENAISFKMRNTFILRPDLGLNGDQLITMPHPLLQFMAIGTLGQAEELQAAVAMGLELIFQPRSAFITATLMQLFFDGIDVNCAHEEPAAQAICQQFHAGAVPGAVPVNATHFKFSLMGAGNHTNAGSFKVARSRSKGTTVGRVLQFNGADQLQVWTETFNGSSCNRFRGTDGTIFAPFMRPQQGLWSYSPQLCRSLSPKWLGKTSYNELPAQRYELSLGASRLEPDWSCYCTSYPDDCPADGTMDLVRCSGLPMVASLPHFFQAQPELVTQVEGLWPSKDKHASTLIFEQLSGTVLSVFNRLQFSLKVSSVPQVAVMCQLRNLTMPLFWIEESLQLDKTITAVLHKKIFSVLSANNLFRWLAIGLGSLGCALGGLFLHLRRGDAKRVGASEEQ
ncbi:sensory neuron membrane protein 1-like [Drosophila albomicans]|uniref:Sensory neuron membrane protein 1 n=1 Tax=Drosophila albomicans TaxID=7291 RepID=A0A6P8WEH3_DROAB|nr:sensory neuron membrane protein 1-like [Drosophila albomicans]